MNKAIKCRIYPTTEQKILFAKTFGCCRKVYNLMLADKIESYKQTGEFVSPTPAMYKKSYPYLKEVDSLALANAQLNLQAAFRNCFNKKRKRRSKFPKFKSKRRSKKSYTTNNQNGTIAIVNDKYVKLPKVGLVKAKIHRKPKLNWIIKSATISQDSDGKFYVSLLFEFEDHITNITKDNISAIGLDYKVNGLYVDSKGNNPHMEHYTDKEAKKLAKLQRQLSKQTGFRKGESPSSNFLKRKKHINKIHKKISNRRKDFLQKQSTEITNQYNVVCIEDLSVKDELYISKKESCRKKRNNINRAIANNGWYSFTTMLEYKLKNKGGYLIKVDKTYPSTQTCSQCNKKQQIPLTTKIYKCNCGLTINRDINAAINIKNEGLRLLRQVV